MKIDSIPPQYIPYKVQPISPQGNTQGDKESPSMVQKSNHCGHSESPAPIKQMSTEDLLKLMMAMEATEKINEVTQDVLSKYIDVM